MKYTRLFIFYAFILQTLCSETSDIQNKACKVDTKGVPSCSQLCINGRGGYSCSCYRGYVLADDNRTCLVTGNEPVMILVTSKTVNVYYTETEDIDTLTNLPDSHVTALGFGPDDIMLIVSRHGKAVYKTKLDVKKRKEEPEVLIDTGLRRVTGVAVDWVTSNIYLVDKEAGQIIVCSWKGDNCSILVKNLVRPCSVLVNVNSRKLLWSEWGANGSDGSIVSSNLDGSTLKMMINNLAKPQDLVLDGTSDVLYWLARPHGVYIIQSINLNTGYRQIYSIESSGHAAPTLSLLTDHLYWTMSNSTLIINKFTGVIEKSLATGSAVRASIYHPVLYRSLTSQANACDNSSCSHLCVPSNNHYGYRCLCPVDMYLDVEGNCSRKEGGESLLVSSISGIYEVPTHFIGYHGFRSRRIVETEVNCLVYDKGGDRIFYHDDTTREIRTISLKYPRRPRTLYSKVHMVEGMALDTTSGVIYWTVNQGSVHAGSVDGSFSRKLISDLSRPRGITVDPEHGFLYICDWGNDAKILRCHMDGSHCLVYFHAHGGHPNMVAIASSVTIETEEMTKWVNTLYWTDSKQNSISYANLGVDVISLDTISLNLSLDSHPYGLVVTDSTIYFTDLNSKYVHYVEKSDVTKEIDMQLDVGILFALDHTHRSIHVSDTVCSMNNGGCTHLCLVKPKGQRTCLCPDSVNNISCTVTEEQALFKTNLSNVLDKEKLKKEFVTIETEREDTVLFWAVPLTGFLIILCAVTSFVACYYRNKKRKHNWMCKFIQYMKARHSEDSEGLVSDSTFSMSDPHFRQYEDIDYPDDSYCLRNLRDHNTRETSMISTDSAFTEMRDFDIYSSIDND